MAACARTAGSFRGCGRLWFSPGNRVGGGRGIRNSAIAAARIPKILVLKGTGEFTDPVVHVLPFMRWLVFARTE